MPGMPRPKLGVERRVGCDTPAGGGTTHLRSYFRLPVGMACTRGFLATVGPEWRGRRLASAVLCAQLLASRNAGYERVTLEVDADSQTGAYRLYRRQGFTPAHQKFAYTLEY